MDRDRDHAPEIRADDGAVDEVVAPQRFGIPSGQARECGANGDGGDAEHERNATPRLPIAGVARPRPAAGAGGPHPSRQERDADHDGRGPDKEDDEFEPCHALRQSKVVQGGPRVEQAVRREGTGPPSPCRPAQAQGPGAAMLLVLDADLVDAGGQRERLDLRVHVGRRRAPDHQLTVEPDVKAVVAGAVDIDRSRLGHIPVAVPARAEEAPRELRVLVQEVERDVRADVLEERRAVEADLRIHPAVQAGPLRREAAEGEQERGQGDGHDGIGTQGGLQVTSDEPNAATTPAPDGPFMHPRAAEPTRLFSSHHRPGPKAVTPARAEMQRAGRPPSGTSHASQVVALKTLPGRSFARYPGTVIMEASVIRQFLNVAATLRRLSRAMSSGTRISHSSSIVEVLGYLSGVLVSTVRARQRRSDGCPSRADSRTAASSAAVGTGREQQLKGFNPELLQGLASVNRKVLQAPGQRLVDVEQHALLADP